MTRLGLKAIGQVRDAQILRSIVSEGCRLDRCGVDDGGLGLRPRVEEGVLLRDTLVMGADRSESAYQRSSLWARGRVPLGLGRGSRVHAAILDKNVRLGCTVQVIHKDRLQEADRSELGFIIRRALL